MGPTPILEMARAYGLRPRLWLLLKYSACSQKHLIQFLGLKELTFKYGLGDFDIKLYRMAPKPCGKSDNFAITTVEADRYVSCFTGENIFCLLLSSQRACLGECSIP